MNEKFDIFLSHSFMPVVSGLPGHLLGLYREGYRPLTPPRVVGGGGGGGQHDNMTAHDISDIHNLDLP